MLVSHPTSNPSSYILSTDSQGRLKSNKLYSRAVPCELTVEGCYDQCCLTGLWSTHAKVEDIMLKAAWPWGRDSSVVNYLLGEPGHTPLYTYVGVPSIRGSTYGDHKFSPLTGTLRDINE